MGKCPFCHSLPTVVDKLWISMEILFFCVGKWDVVFEKGVGKVDMRSSIHSYSVFIHKLFPGKHRFEQGFSLLSTTKPSGYYDYLYIHRSKYETNLSQNWGKK